MTLDANARLWGSFNLREDQFGDLRIGSPLELLPLGGGERVSARVTEILARGEFATRRAARVVSDYDVNTFLLRADPLAASVPACSRA